MAKEKVNCSFCDKDILRYKINPNTKKPIKNFFCDNNCKGKWQIKEREKLGFTKDWLISEYIDKNKKIELAKTQIEDIATWEKGFLTFDKTTLKDSLEEQITSITDVITKRMSETDEKLEAKEEEKTEE